MAVWTIAGETGKAWNATAKTLEERAVDSGTLAFRSLEADTLTLQIIPEDFTTFTMPELGQVIKLYRSGTLFFTGHVTDTPVTVSSGAQIITVVVSGPWWWMERINYTSTQTDGSGSTGTRMTGVFGDSTSGTDLQAAIQTAIDQCATLGVPIANIAGGSTVASYFQVPRVTLNQGTCAFVITELSRLVPDTMVYFDYSTATPTMHVTRRGVATTRTIALTDTNDLSIKPMLEMQVSRVELPYVTRDTNGLTKFQTQASGTTTTGKVQIVTVSGPELDTYLPNDYLERTTVRTYTDLESYVLRSDGTFTDAIANGLTTELEFPTELKTFAYYSTSATTGTAGITHNTTGFTVVDAKGEPVSTAGKYFLAAEETPSWLTDQLTKVTVSGAYYYEFRDAAYASPYNATNLIETYTPPAWFSSLQTSQATSGYIKPSATHYRVVLFRGLYSFDGYLSSTDYHWTGTARSGTGATTIVLATTASAIDDFYNGLTVEWTRNNFLGQPVKFSDTILDYNGATKTATLTNTWSSTERPASGNVYALQGHPVYQPSDYSFIAPPTGLAANLLAAQNFVPYEGEITLTEQTAGTTRYRGCKVNVSSSISAHASMAALVSAETLDLKSGETVIELGTPPRIDYRTFVDRIRKTPQDNIVFNNI